MMFVAVLLPDNGSLSFTHFGTPAELRDSQDAESKDVESKDAESKDAKSKDAESKDAESKDDELGYTVSTQLYYSIWQTKSSISLLDILMSSSSLRT